METMTKENKELLLKDLCARLPYGVKVEYKNEIFDVEHVSPMYEEVKLDTYETWTIDVSDIKPYLFPLSRLNNLTEEQRNTLKVKCDWNDEEADAQSILVLYQKHFVMKTDVIDWLNENHFDYRGLIEKGLANDATNKNVY
jgi:hypothetical protein